MLSPTSALAGTAPTPPTSSSQPTTAIAAARRRTVSGVLAAAAPRQRALHLALGLLLGQRLPLVVAALAAGQRNLDLGPAVLEVERDRHQGDAALLGLADETQDLGAVQQQLALAARLVVGPGPLGVLRDVHASEPQLAVADVRVAVDQVRVAGAQRLHLGAGEHQAGLVDVVDVVVVTRLAVLRHQLAALLARHQSLPISHGPKRSGSDPVPPPVR